MRMYNPYYKIKEDTEDEAVVTKPEVLTKNNHYKEEANGIKKESTEILDQISNQENRQDLDQNQQMNVTPLQNNTNSINIAYQNYTGNITGSVFKDKERQIPITTAEIYLYFGDNINHHIEKRATDEEGKFKIEELPPGYYTLEIYYNGKLVDRLINIKIMPLQTIFVPIVWNI